MKRKKNINAILILAEQNNQEDYMTHFFKIEAETSEVNSKCQVFVKMFDYKRRNKIALKCNLYTIMDIKHLKYLLKM